MKHIVTTILLVAIAMAAAGPVAFAAEPASGPDRSQAEVQIGLCSPIDHVVRALDLRPKGAPIEVWQIDDPATSLLARGLRLRLRVGADGRAQLTLKVADQDCARVDAKFVPPREGKCEYDVYGATAAGAVSINSKLHAKTTREVLDGRVAVANVLSPAQIRYLQEVVDVWPLPAGVRALGPMQLQTYRTAGGRYDVDVSNLPSGERFAEISAKVKRSDASSTMQAMQVELQRVGVEMCVDQSSQAANKLRALLR